MPDVSFSLQTHQSTTDRDVTLVDVLSKAFADDRLMLELLQDGRWQRIRERYFKIELSRSDLTITAEDSGQIVGAILVATPDGSESISSEFLTLFRMMFLLGKDYGRTQHIARMIGSGRPASPHWYINHLAVLPESQHRKIGSGLLSRVTELARIDSDEVYLDCACEVRPFYEQAGFETVTYFPSIDVNLMRFTG